MYRNFPMCAEYFAICVSRVALSEAQRVTRERDVATLNR